MGTEKLIEEASLAHPRLPDDRHELAVADTGLIEGPVHGLKLRLPPHEAAELAGRKRLQVRPGGPGTHQLKDLYGMRQPLDGDRAERFDLDQSLCEPEGFSRQ